MSVLAVVGAQWGDEGKGKIVDLLAQKAHVVVRSQGGGNAGHEVWVGKKDFVMHLIPSGILHKGKVCVIGNGVVVDPDALGAEIIELRRKGISVTPKNLLISPLAQVTFSLHRAYDAAREDAKGSTKIGTTKRGIGPTYSDKVNRVGVRVADLFHPERCRDLLIQSLKIKNLVFKELYNVPGVSINKLMREAQRHAKIMKPFVVDTIEFLNSAVDKKKKVLLEGAQGTMLDVDYGTYPFVTSSNSTSGGAATGSGLGPNRIEKVMGVCKAYTTRVGEGPFPTEFDPVMSEKMRDLGGEFGRTTGRARRCGWLDLVVLKHSALVNGMSWLGMTKVDILDQMDEIWICTSYKIKGKKTKRFPAAIADVEDAVPQYTRMKGWKSDTTKARRWADLPVNCKKYLKRIEKEVSVPLGLVSVGPERNQTLFVDKRLEKFQF